jgi:hypothetical protein
LRSLISSFDVAHRTEAPERVLAFTLGSFETCVLVLAIVLVAHATGDLTDMLDGLNPLVALTYVVLLWALTCYYTLCALNQIGVRSLNHVSISRMVLYGTKWGALEGRQFALVAGAFLVVFLNVQAVIALAPLSALFATTLVVLGVIFASVVGMVAGAMLGLLSAIVMTPLVHIARFVAAPSGSDGNVP